MTPEGIKSTEAVAALCGCKPITARVWAAANGVPFIGSGYHKNYLWTDADIERFKAREKPGRRRPEKDKKNAE
jgi:hypothetical protein